MTDKQRVANLEKLCHNYRDLVKAQDDLLTAFKSGDIYGTLPLRQHMRDLRAAIKTCEALHSAR